MNLFVGNTDLDWYRFLAERQPDEVNFWRPSRTRFVALDRWEPFLFKLKSPVNRIAGGSFFVNYTPLPLSLAWEVFGEKNGADDYSSFRDSILQYMDALRHPDPEIGCIVVTQPIFLDEDDWIDVPPDWSPNIVSGKTYDFETGIGAKLWAEFQEAAQYTRLRRTPEDALNAVFDAPRCGETYAARVRLGQGGFRSLVTEVYQRRCAMTGERTLPVLQASHIKLYALSGPHRVDNGLLLRADLHILFDRGYVTVTQDHHIEVSRRIKEEFENGRDHYAMHGQKLRVLPDSQEDRPAEDYVAWHNDHVFVA